MAFSLPGFLIVAIILLPNLLFILFPPKNIPENLKDAGQLMNMIEHGGRILFFILLILTPYDSNLVRNPILFGLMLFCAAIYYALWLHYMRKERQFSVLFESVLGIPIPMALFPILSFTFATLWLHAWVALIPLILFAIGHIVNTRVSARQTIS